MSGMEDQQSEREYRILCESADRTWSARGLADRYRCQALRFEGHRCSNVITCTVTGGEWMEITEWHLSEDYPNEIDFTEVITVDGREFDGSPDSVLMIGDAVLINTVVRAWCGDCAAEERKARDFASVLIIDALTDGAYIPTGTRKCVNGYDESACDAFCGHEDHIYRVAHVTPRVPVAGNVIRWDAPDDEGIVYGVTTDEQVTVSITAPWLSQNFWIIEVANRDAEVLASDTTMRWTRELHEVKAYAVTMVNRALRIR